MRRAWLLLAAFPLAAQEFTLEQLRSHYVYDAAAPLGLETRLAYVDGAAAVSEIHFASPRDGRVTGFLVEPVRKGGKHAGLVFGHWGPGNRTEFLPEAILYAGSGVVSILIDYPWTRPGPWRRRPSYLDDPEKAHTVYTQAVVDLRRAFDVLLARPDIDARRIGYVGHSYGAQWGAVLAAIDKRMKTCVLVGGVGSQADIYLHGPDEDLVQFRKDTPREKIEAYVNAARRRDAIVHVPHAAPVSLFFQFGRHEVNFDEASMKRYFAAASEPKRVAWYPTGHELNDVRALADRAAWLSRQVGFPSVREALRKMVEGRERD